MTQENISVTPSHALTRALRMSNRQAIVFSGPNTTLVPIAYEPGTVTDPVARAVDDGVWRIGKDGMHAPERVKLLFLCDGSPGSSFFVRLYAWRVLGNNPETLVWIPMLLAEFACSAGDAPGPANPQGPYQRLLTETERLCDTIVLTNGASWKVISPGGNIPGYALVELDGTQDIQFDFASPDNPTLGMNALFARA